MSRQRIGCRKKSTQASQYRVGRYGLTAAAELSATSTPLVISAASAPSVAASDESVSVDRNSAIAPTPSMDTAIKAMAPSVRMNMSAGVIVVPESVLAMTPDVRPLVPAVIGLSPNSIRPVTYAVSATATTATSTNTTSAIS